jgi:hypothetical protein
MQLLTDFAAVNAVVNLSLCNVQRRAVALEAALDRTGAELVQVEMATAIDPVNSASITHKDLIRVELDVPAKHRLGNAMNNVHESSRDRTRLQRRG